MSIDTDIVVWVNGHHSAFLDDFMWTVSTPTTWIPLYVLLLVLLGFAYKRKTWSGTMHTLFTILIGFAIAVALSDYISSGILKPLICRLRPTHDGSVPLLHFVNGYKGGIYGFCSSHAANSMAVALLFSLLYRKKNSHHSAYALGGFGMLQPHLSGGTFPDRYHRRSVCRESDGSGGLGDVNIGLPCG